MATNQSPKVMYHYYPDTILKPEYKNRSVKIFVKTAAVSSKDLSLEKFKEAVEKTDTDVNKLIDDTIQRFNDGFAVSDIRNTNVLENTKVLLNCDFIYGCCLPLPNEFVDNQSHNWNRTDNFISRLAGNFKLGPGGEIDKTLGEATARMGFRKPLIDPGYFQNYEGSNPRGFTLTFDFIPNNREESINIMNIILNLKKFSLPRSLAGGVSLLSPFMFEIEIGNDNLKKLVNMSDVVLTEMSVNYGADGGMQMFSDGVPKYITMSISFTERSLTTAEYYD